MSQQTSAIGQTLSYEEKIQKGRIFLAKYGHLSKRWQLVELLKQVTNIDDGYTASELSATLYPGEVDSSGFPTKEARNKVLGQIALARAEVKGTMIIYSLPYRAPPSGHLEYRYFNFVSKPDVEMKDTDLAKRRDSLESARKDMWVTFDKGEELRNKEFQTKEHLVLQRYNAEIRTEAPQSSSS